VPTVPFRAYCAIRTPGNGSEARAQKVTFCLDRGPANLSGLHLGLPKFLKIVGLSVPGLFFAKVVRTSLPALSNFVGICTRPFDIFYGKSVRIATRPRLPLPGPVPFRAYRAFPVPTVKNRMPVVGMGVAGLFTCAPLGRAISTGRMLGWHAPCSITMTDPCLPP
jgi:hypothetical protein